MSDEATWRRFYRPPVILPTDTVADIVAKTLRAHIAVTETYAVLGARRGLDNLAERADEIGAEIAAATVIPETAAERLFLRAMRDMDYKIQVSIPEPTPEQRANRELGPVRVSVSSESYRTAPEDECRHGVTFDQDESANMEWHEVRQRWPRLDGPCPLGCGYSGIAYASMAHYVCGDW